MGIAFENCYKVPVISTFTMNIFGERQHLEKFIPLCIRKILKGEKVLIHADKTKTKSGSRFWIHARNVCKALLFLTENGKIGEGYNIVGEKEISNLEMAQFIAKTIGKPLKYEMVNWHESRPGHDLRYALDGAKLKEMGFPITYTGPHDNPNKLFDDLEKAIDRERGYVKVIADRGGYGLESIIYIILDSLDQLIDVLHKLLE